MNTVMTVKQQLESFDIKSAMLRSDLEIIIKDQSEMNEFQSKFLSSSKGLYFAAQDYRLHKIVYSSVEFSEFEKDYGKDKRVALTNLFKHYVQDEEITIVNDKIKQGKFTLKGLYDKFMSKPSYRLQRIVLITKS